MTTNKNKEDTLMERTVLPLTSPSILPEVDTRITSGDLPEDEKVKKKTIEKAVGLPSDMDEEHEYVHNTGFYGIRAYWYKDKAENYWKYTNAPEDHEEHDPRLGEPMIHPDQPLPHTDPEYFTEEGFKRNQALTPELLPERNPAYDPKSATQVWFEVATSGELVRFIYRDTDVRENLDLWVQQQLRVADASLLQYRRFAYDSFNGEHPKDKITGVILMLIDQALFLPEELADATVADLEFSDRTIRIGGKKFVCDDIMFDFFTSLSQDRKPSEPLFQLQTVHGLNSIGYNYLYAVLDTLNMNPHYLIAWHANHMFSRILHRMAIDKVPAEKVEDEAYEELARVLGTGDDVRFLVDVKVKNTLLDNYSQEEEGEENFDEASEPLDELAEEPVEKSTTREMHDHYGVFQVSADLMERRSDELQFSIWLHAEPMHDLTPEEEDAIQEAIGAVIESAEAEGTAPETGEETGEAAPEEEGGGPAPEGGGAASSPAPEV